MGTQVAPLLVFAILIFAQGFSQANDADHQVGLDEVKQMSPKELNSFIYNTYMMYQSLKNIAKM